MFARPLVVLRGGLVERDLLEAAALLASLGPAEHALAAVLPERGIHPSLPVVMRSVFAARGVRRVSLRLLAHPDLDAVFELAREHRADLVAVRHPRGERGGRTLARRLLAETPCATYFGPRHGGLSLDRIVAVVELSSEGAALLEQAARLCAAAAASDLLAVHSSFRDTLAAGAEVEERFRYEKLLDLYRFKAKVPLHGVRCTPVLKERPNLTRGTLEAAAEHHADLVVLGRPWVADPPLMARRRVAEDLLWQCALPLLQLPSSLKASPLRARESGSSFVPTFN